MCFRIAVHVKPNLGRHWYVLETEERLPEAREPLKDGGENHGDDYDPDIGGKGNFSGLPED